MATVSIEIGLRVRACSSEEFVHKTTNVLFTAIEFSNVDGQNEHKRNDDASVCLVHWLGEALASDLAVTFAVLEAHALRVARVARQVIFRRFRPWVLGRVRKRSFANDFGFDGVWLCLLFVPFANDSAALEQRPFGRWVRFR